MRNLKSLARLLEREERYTDSCGETKHHRPGIAGAFYWGGKTVLTNGYWGIIADGEIPDLMMAEGKGVDIEQILKSAFCGCPPEECTDFNNFPPEQVEMLLKCFSKDRQIYTINNILIIKGKDGYAFVMPNKKE